MMILQVLLRKLQRTMIMNFRRRPVALLMLYLLVTLYIGLINIEVQGFGISSPTNSTMTKWRNMYVDGNRKKNGNDRVNNGGYHHMDEDTDGVGGVSGKYIPPALTFPRERDKYVAHVAPTQEYSIITWASKIAQWTVKKDGTAGCFEVEALNSHVAAELFTVETWPTWKVWWQKGCKYRQRHSVSVAGAAAPVVHV